jgi:hypothetical protein
MEEKNRHGGLVVGTGARGLAGDGDRVMLLSGVSGRPNSSALLPSCACLLRSESTNKYFSVTE